MFEYLGTAVKNQNFIREEIRKRLNSVNDCQHPVQNNSSSRLLPKRVRSCERATIKKAEILQNLSLLLLSGELFWSVDVT
jgi:hypothetical protein